MHIGWGSAEKGRLGWGLTTLTASGNLTCPRSACLIKHRQHLATAYWTEVVEQANGNRPDVAANRLAIIRPMTDIFCQGCGNRIADGAQVCPSCGRHVPGTEGYRRAKTTKRNASAATLLAALVLATYGFFTDGGPRVISTRRGSSTAQTIKIQLIAGGIGIAAFSAFSLYRVLRDE